MIFEVLWSQPRENEQKEEITPTLVTYADLKKYAYRWVIHWLEVMVKNSVVELEKKENELNNLTK